MKMLKLVAFDSVSEGFADEAVAAYDDACRALLPVFYHVAPAEAGVRETVFQPCGSSRLRAAYVPVRVPSCAAAQWATCGLEPFGVALGYVFDSLRPERIPARLPVALYRFRGSPYLGDFTELVARVPDIDEAFIVKGAFPVVCDFRARYPKNGAYYEMGFGFIRLAPGQYEENLIAKARETGAVLTRYEFANDEVRRSEAVYVPGDADLDTVREEGK